MTVGRRNYFNKKNYRYIRNHQMAPYTTWKAIILMYNFGNQ